MMFNQKERLFTSIVTIMTYFEHKSAMGQRVPSFVVTIDYS